MLRVCDGGCTEDSIICTLQQHHAKTGVLYGPEIPEGEVNLPSKKNRRVQKSVFHHWFLRSAELLESPLGGRVRVYLCPFLPAKASAPQCTPDQDARAAAVILGAAKKHPLQG